MEPNGKWRLTMPDFDQATMDLCEPAFIEFSDGHGSFHFICVYAEMTRISLAKRTGKTKFMFSGHDDNYDEISGRGWAEISEGGDLKGHLHFSNDEDYDFTGTRIPLELLQK